MSEQIDALVDVQTEAAVLGAMLCDNTLIAAHAGTLRVDDFSESLHGRIFSAMLRFHGNGKVANAVTLRPVFQNDESALGGGYLDKISESVAIVDSASEFVEHIRGLSARRRVRAAAQTTIDRLNGDFDAPVSEIAGGVQDASYAATGADEAKPRSLRDSIGLVRGRHKRIAENEGRTGATNALISDIDKTIGPLEGAMVVYLGGRPGMGKSMTASSAAIGYAANGNPVLYLKAEMNDEQIGMRQLSDLSFALGRGIPHDHIKSGKMKPEETMWMERAEQFAEHIPLRVQDVKGWTIQRVEAFVARETAFLVAQGKKPPIVIMDYLQLLEALDEDGRAIEDERKKVNAISKGFRRIADRLNAPVIALSQLSRGLEARQDKRPTMSDLKESGKLEEDADVVLLVYREEYYLADQKPKIHGDVANLDSKAKTELEKWENDMRAAEGKLDLIVGKNRHGGRYTRTCRFVGKYTAVRGSDVDTLDDGYGQPLLFGEWEE